MTAAGYIAALNLQPHPEGGYYAQTYQATEQMAREALPRRFGGDRAFSTAIYFLLENHNRSTLHRIQSDEVWHFYAGGPLQIYVITPKTGELNTIRLGNRMDRGEVFQAVVPAGCWFGSKPIGDVDAPPFSLVGCTVAPGFDFADFELAEPEVMLAQYPQHSGVIQLLR
ncbi:cupin domain-containing protein [Fibrella sp. HMF5335]|uniref:Cupin domain-containing protein n=1 Tax=Fibrella rubiginis TaxID=2817060 RepID=A0A939GKK8_9BACT|nr:cupin domain-containing protein [Fibrella rubiginis]MBO0938984.1 cupin domain-containing protein [Fibrella rubiginis]